MQKYRLEKKHPTEVLKEVQKGFETLPVITRDCVKALNTLVYNMQHQKFEQIFLKEVIFQILRGLTSKDPYLKRCIYNTLLELSKVSSDGILSINSLLRDIDDPKSKNSNCDSALRTLFSNLPSVMYYDFEKYIKSGVHASNDMAIILAQQYLYKDTLNIPYITETRLADNISDYHRSFFVKMPINKYSGLLEIKKMANDNPEQLLSFFYSSTDPILLLEAAKTLLILPPEIASPYIGKAIHALSTLFKRDVVSIYASINLINKLTARYADKISKINKEIENLVNSQYESISMLAILTLMKTGTGETIKRLTARLEPYMKKMSANYKIMAIDTMERLAIKECNSKYKNYNKTREITSEGVVNYVNFLKRAFLERDSMNFKLYIVQKFEQLIRSCSAVRITDSKSVYTDNKSVYTDNKSVHTDNKSVRTDTNDFHVGNILGFLSGYLEDPEYYQVSISILGIIGEYLNSPKELPHIYNRLLLDNEHVRKAALQSLYDLSRRGVIDNCGDALIAFRDENTATHCDILFQSIKLISPTDRFDIAELGDLADEVGQYLDQQADSSVEINLIKECRRILIADNTDVQIWLTKLVKKDVIEFKFEFINMMENVCINSGQLTLIREDNERFILQIGSEGRTNKIVEKRLEISCKDGDVFNGLLEYCISMEGDTDETESDSFSIEPFSITLFDFAKPASHEESPVSSTALEVVLDCKPVQATAQLIDTINLHMITDGDTTIFTGNYYDEPIRIVAELEYTDVTRMMIELYCDDEDILRRMAAVFE